MLILSIIIVPASASVRVDVFDVFRITNVNINFSSTQNFTNIDVGGTYINFTGTGIFQIIPSSPTVNITIRTYNTTGDHRILMNESGDNDSIEVTYKICDRAVNSNYSVRTYWDSNGTKFQDFYVRSNGTGCITYNSTRYGSPRWTDISQVALTSGDSYLATVVAVTASIGGIYIVLRRIRKG